MKSVMVKTVAVTLPVWVLLVVIGWRAGTAGVLLTFALAGGISVSGAV